MNKNFLYTLNFNFLNSVSSYAVFESRKNELKSFYFVPTG